MNGHKELPQIGFGPDCTYDMLDILKDWCARIWFKQGVILVALWVTTGYDGDEDYDYVDLKVWSEEDQDYNQPLRVPADDITRIEVL